MTPSVHLQIAEPSEAIDIRAADQTLTPAQRDELRWLIFHRPSERDRIRQIQEVVALFFGLEVREMSRRCRFEEIVWPRQVSEYLAWLDLDCGTPMLGRLLGRNGWTVLNSIKQVSNRIETDKRKAAQIIELQTALGINQDGK